MIYITHDQEEAFALSDRIMVMDNGVIRQIDTPENIIKNPADDYVRRFVIHNIQLKIDSLRRFAQIPAEDAGTNVWSTENPGTDPLIYGQLILNKGTKTIQR